MAQLRDVSNGAYALDLLQKQVGKLVQLQAPVAAGEGTEPLHQMRVAMRRLSTTLVQFEPALQVPAALNNQRLAKWVRRLGMARDLDVLRERLEVGLLPQLPEAEGRTLRPVLKQLRRERHLAYAHVVEVLKSPSYLEGLAQLQRWFKQPEFTALGQQPIAAWIADWQLPCLAGLFLHPGWQVGSLAQDPDCLHELRRQLKQVRYRLENLAPLQGPSSAPWIGRFKRGQELLGECNDLLVLQRAINDQLQSELALKLPQLAWLLNVSQSHCWERWSELAQELLPAQQRRRLRRDLLWGGGASSKLDRLKLGLGRLAGPWG